MKFVSFKQGHRDAFGAMVGDDSIADLSNQWSSLKDAIAHASLRELQDAVASAPLVALADITLALPVPDAERYVCAGLNFSDHVLEGGTRKELPANPSLFLRSHSTFVPHGQPLIKPDWSESFDYEAELAVVIGKGGRHIALEDAMSHVFGYTLLMDGSVRDVQFDHSLTAGKNFYASGAVGPWVVTADEVGDPTQLQLIGRVNGQVRQSGSISDLIFDIPSLISYWSRVDSLSAGDIVSVGTPAGVGFAMKPPQFLKVGDIMEVEVPGVGLLSNTVASDESR